MRTMEKIGLGSMVQCPPWLSLVKRRPKFAPYCNVYETSVVAFRPSGSIASPGSSSSSHFQISPLPAPACCLQDMQERSDHYFALGLSNPLFLTIRSCAKAILLHDALSFRRGQVCEFQNFFKFVVLVLVYDPGSRSSHSSGPSNRTICILSQYSGNTIESARHGLCTHRTFDTDPRHTLCFRGCIGGN
jgi:hypothetical protein